MPASQSIISSNQPNGRAGEKQQDDFEIRGGVEEQVGYEEFLERIEESKKYSLDKTVSERELNMLSAIIETMTEVYGADDEKKYKINGRFISVGAIKEQYKKITKEHVDSVLEFIYHGDFKPRNIRAYLRAMLYNVVDEIDLKELAMKNEVKSLNK